MGSHDTIYKREKERGRENKTASCVPGLGAPARLVEGTPFLMRRRSGDVDTLGGRDSLQRWHVAEAPVPRKGRGWAGGRDEDPPSGVLRRDVRGRLPALRCARGSAVYPLLAFARPRAHPWSVDGSSSSSSSCDQHVTHLFCVCPVMLLTCARIAQRTPVSLVNIPHLAGDSHVSRDEVSSRLLSWRLSDRRFAGLPAAAGLSVRPTLGTRSSRNWDEFVLSQLPLCQPGPAR